MLEQHDALLCPTMSQAARPVDEDDDQWYDEDPDGRYRGLDMTAVFNYMSQCPALSVPAGFTDEDLPVGLQIVARRYRDDVALQIGAALERVRPWAARRPPGTRRVARSRGRSGAWHQNGHNVTLSRAFSRPSGVIRVLPCVHSSGSPVSHGDPCHSKRAHERARASLCGRSGAWHQNGHDVTVTRVFARQSGGARTARRG